MSPEELALRSAALRAAATSFAIEACSDFQASLFAKALRVIDLRSIVALAACVYANSRAGFGGEASESQRAVFDRARLISVALGKAMEKAWFS